MTITHLAAVFVGTLLGMALWDAIKAWRRRRLRPLERAIEQLIAALGLEMNDVDSVNVEATRDGVKVTVTKGGAR